MSSESLIETDVLVIGGGLAGCFASIKAKEQGADVVLVDKGYVSKTGGTPYAGDTMVFNPEWGHDLDAWMEQVSVLGEYVNNRQWNENAEGDEVPHRGMSWHGLRTMRPELSHGCHKDG